MVLDKILSKIIGTQNERELKRIQPLVERSFGPSRSADHRIALNRRAGARSGNHSAALIQPADLDQKVGYVNINGADHPGMYRKEGVTFQPIIPYRQYSQIEGLSTPEARPFYYAADRNQYYQFVNGQWQTVAQLHRRRGLKTFASERLGRPPALGLLPAALATLAPAVRALVKVGAAQRVPLRARDLRQLPSSRQFGQGASSHILSPRDWCQMIRIHTGSIAAAMIEDLTWWDGSVVLFEDHPVGRTHPPALPCLTVAP